MKIKELINELKEYNQEADITLTTSETITLSFISDENGTKKDTKQVFIEGCDFDGRLDNEEYV